ncbi:hypothetical protein K438DRAFT_1983182 [Mycena galopus ATCC 62051]|nr:hypothetical protein K438DRAFT_1983182 [Mycena galopus ATCC 62051]
MASSVGCALKCVQISTDTRQVPDDTPPPGNFLKCPTCKCWIDVGTGGMGNLEKRHKDTPNCLKNKAKAEAAAKKPPPPPKKKPIHASLSNFFFKPKELVPPKVPALPILQGTAIIPVAPTVTSDLPTAVDAPDDFISDLARPLVISEEAQDLLRQLKAKIALIRAHAPLAEPDHPLSCFSRDPESSIMVAHACISKLVV